ncbi:MAG: hypothetical protein IKO03_16520 [Lachnospiraceae bacterium]|nr:hypothetical protein [Lachnospiraceae bacterium]
MTVVLNYKSFYEAFKVGVVDNGFTPVAEILFRPLFEAHDVFDVNGEPYEVDNQKASKWGNGQSNIPKEIQEVAGTNASLNKMITYFNTTVLPCVIKEALLDEMIEAVEELVKTCNLSESKKNALLNFCTPDKYGEFLARVFQRALLEENKVPKPSKQEMLSKNAWASVSEFDNTIRKRIPRPQVSVPDEIQPEEMEYVGQLFKAYEETTGAQVEGPDDLVALNYRDHFDFQRINYYRAEIVHRCIRDSVRNDEVDCFDYLKDEIETGITTVASPRTHYDNPVERVNAVTDKAGSIMLSYDTEQGLFGLIGVGEKMGVCHMLVNDSRLWWVDKNGEQTV